MNRLILILCSHACVFAAEFFVATDGSDTHPGTLEKPFATLMRAQAAASPGDTVQIRGGKYTVPADQIARCEKIWAYVVYLDKSGEPERRIVYQAYRDERPVFDFSQVKVDARITAFYVPGSWIHLKGLEVTGVQVVQTGHTQSICVENAGDHNRFELLSFHDNQAIGYYQVRGSHALILNCDAYRNHDFTSEDKRGGNVDGFGCHPSKGSVGNVFRGCRAWFNSDDGYDCITAYEAVTFENCWAFYNGYGPQFERLADGNGFKAGGYGKLDARRLPQPLPRHAVRFCLAARNKANGFYANHHPGGCDWIHNSAFGHGANFNMLGREMDNVTDIDGTGHVLKNNLGMGARSELTRMNAAACEAAGNTFTLGLKLTEKDFVSLDEAQMLRPRQPNGDLPLLDFMRLSDHSQALDRGVEAGAPFNGAAPDPGAFER